MKSQTTYVRPVSKNSTVATSEATTSGAFGNELPPIILTHSTVMYENRDIKKTKKNKNFNKNNEEEDSLSTSSSNSSTLSSSPRRSRRRRSSEAVFNPNQAPRRSSMKDSSSSSSSSSQERKRRQQQPKRSKSDTVKVYLPGRTHPIIRRRSIQFDEEVSVLEIRPAKSLVKNKNYNDGNTNNPESTLWFQQDEYDNIRQKNYKLISRINKDDTYDRTNGNKKKYCTRGLERLMCREECQVKRGQAEDAVLVEQYLQREDGIYSSHHIADLYRTISSRSQLQATHRGKEDAIIAESILGIKFEKKHHRHYRGSNTSSLRGSSFHESSSSKSSRTESNTSEHQQEKCDGRRRLRRRSSM